MGIFIGQQRLGYLWGKITSALRLKADASSVYTKTETDTMLEGTVWHKAQTLSSAQQTQARSNIGAQEALVSGTNIKTVNNQSLLGSGNISIEVSGEYIAYPSFTINNAGHLIMTDGAKGLFTIESGHLMYNF